MKKIKRFVKEIKRVRWPKPSDAKKTFWTSFIFISACALALFGLAVGLTFMWDGLGVGLNG